MVGSTLTVPARCAHWAANKPSIPPPKMTSLDRDAIPEDSSGLGRFCMYPGTRRSISRRGIQASQSGAKLTALGRDEPLCLVVAAQVDWVKRRRPESKVFLIGVAYRSPDAPLPVCLDLGIWARDDGRGCLAQAPTRSWRRAGCDGRGAHCNAAINAWRAGRGMLCRSTSPASSPTPRRRFAFRSRRRTVSTKGRRRARANVGIANSISRAPLTPAGRGLPVAAAHGTPASSRRGG